jgi:hypothetical protein
VSSGCISQSREGKFLYLVGGAAPALSRKLHKRHSDKRAKVPTKSPRGRRNRNTAGRGVGLARAADLALRYTLSAVPLLGRGGHKIWMMGGPVTVGQATDKEVFVAFDQQDVAERENLSLRRFR